MPIAHRTKRRKVKRKQMQERRKRERPGPTSRNGPSHQSDGEDDEVAAITSKSKHRDRQRRYDERRRSITPPNVPTNNENEDLAGAANQQDHINNNNNKDESNSGHVNIPTAASVATLPFRNISPNRKTTSQSARRSSRHRQQQRQQQDDDFTTNLDDNATTTTANTATKRYNTRGKRVNYLRLNNGLDGQELSDDESEPTATRVSRRRVSASATTTAEPTSTVAATVPAMTMTIATAADVVDNNAPVATGLFPPTATTTPTVAECIGNIVNGGELDVQLHELAQVQLATALFGETIQNNIKMFYCTYCKERFFDKQPCAVDGEKCKDCFKDRNNPLTWSHLNMADPFYPSYPFHLPKLSQIEEMLIARSHIVMTCFQISGHVEYRGNVLNIQQENERIVQYVPLLPTDLPCFIVRKARQSDASARQNLRNFHDFRVSRAKLQAWIEFLILSNPLYRQNVVYNQQHLQEIPEDGSIVDSLPIVVEHAEVTNEPNQDLATDEPATDDIPNALELGPAHNGASGMPTDEDPIRHYYLQQPVITAENQQSVIMRYLQDNFVGTEQNPMEWPPATRYMSEYSDSNLLCSAFPTLYPYGSIGDATFRDRLHTITMAEANRHLLKYAIKVPGTNQYRYPFAEHPRWCYYVYNIAERHRAEIQRSVFMTNHTQYGDMTVDQIRQLVTNPGRRDELMSIVSQMQSYNANINGSDSYLYKSRQKLECLIAQEGMPTFYFTLTAADNHWADLHQHFNLVYDPLSTEQQKAKLRRKMIRDNQHVVDGYFFQRVKLLLNKWFDDAGLPLKWSWFRIEYQERGTAHAHGCLRLDCDPNISILARKVAHARQLQHILRQHNIDLEEAFSFDETRDDKLLFEGAELQRNLSQDEILEAKTVIAEGVKAHRIITNFHDFLLTTSHPDPPVDATTSQRDPSTRYDECDNNPHPTSVSLPDVLEKSDVEKTEHYCRLINTVERHACQQYCLRPKRGAGVQQSTIEPGLPQQADAEQQVLCCRFDYPKPISEKTHLGIIMKWVGSGVTRRKHTEIVMLSKRNDLWLNSHSRSLMGVWQANMDIQLTIDIGKITQYMTKYMTKVEHSVPKNVSGMVSRLLQSAETSGGSPQAVLKRLMAQLLGQRAMSKQETHHLIMSLSIVECSKTFENVSLSDTLVRIEPPGEQEIAEGRIAGMTIVQAYAKRNLESSWAKAAEFVQQQHSLATMNLATFCSKFKIYSKGEFKHKIHGRLYKAKDVIIQFQPSRLSALPSSPNYTEYCRFSLMKYKPWQDHPKETYGGVQDIPTDAESGMIKTAWLAFISNRQNDSVPEWFFQELDSIISEQGRMRHEANNHPHLVAPENWTEGELADDEPTDADWTNAIDFDGNVVNINNDDLDPIEVISWSVNQDWRNDVQSPVGNVRDFLALQLGNNEPYVRPIVLYEELNDKQKLAFKMAVTVANYDDNESSTDGGDGLARCMIMLGRGGTGKSFTINAIVHAVGGERVAVMATTGKAASLVGGCTLHDRADGFSLPIGNAKFKNLEGESEQRLQERFQNITLVIIDEFSMIRAKEIIFINKRLMQAKSCRKIFGGVGVLLVGDPGQLPAVLGAVLWEMLSCLKNQDDKDGATIYLSAFQSVIELLENRRVDPNDPDSVAFCNLLDNIRDAEVTEADWQLMTTRSMDTMGRAQWEGEGFKEDDVTHLCNTNNAKETRNLRGLMKLGKPIAKIDGEHTGRWNGVSSDSFHGLEASLYLCEGARVMVVNNSLKRINITNGSIGFVKSIKFDEAKLNDNGTLQKPCLPDYVWVEFEDYNGSSFFPDDDDDTRSNWVPIFPYTARYWSSATNETTRTQLPIKLSWGWTIHKSQGQTLQGKFVIRLGAREFSPGLTYVATSRATALKNICFAGGLSLARVTTGLQSKAIEKRKAHEKVLRQRELLTIAKIV